MPIGITYEPGYQAADLSWLGSRRGVDTARTITLDAEAFSNAEGGIVRAGTPVQRAEGGLYAPYADGPLAGFTLNDASVARGDESVALLDTGRVKVDRLPVDFSAPADPGQFVFIEGGN